MGSSSLRIFLNWERKYCSVTVQTLLGNKFRLIHHTSHKTFQMKHKLDHRLD